MLGALLILAGCITKEPLAGKRISVFDLDKKLRAVRAKSAPKITLPKARVNLNWAQIGGTPAHTPQHLVFGKKAKEILRIQAGSAGSVPFVFQPIVAQGKVFVFDGDSQLKAFDMNTGAALWSQDFYMEDSFGGALAYDSGRVFVSTGGGTIAALASANGNIIWRKEIGLAFRAAPVVWQGKVFFMSFNNMLTLRDSFSGKEIWNHSGISETSSLLMPSAVAVANDVAIVPYSSGEVFALRAGNKEFIWTDNLLRQGLGAGSSNAGFIAVPAISQNRVYMISNADYVVAVDLRNGKRLWSQHVSGVNMPWVAGKQVYALSQEGFLLSLSQDKGLVLWRTPLNKRDENVVWYGPVLASSSLWLTSSDGRLAQVSPANGKIVDVQKLSDGFSTPPVVAAKRMFLLSNDMELIVLKGA